MPPQSAHSGNVSLSWNAERLRHSSVPAVWLCRAHCAIGDEFAAPRFPAHFLGSQEILKVDRRHARPHAPWAAEIRNAGFCTDARASEKDYAPGGTDQFDELADARLHLPGVE
jgi:hypothetical protein